VVVINSWNISSKKNNTKLHLSACIQFLMAKSQVFKIKVSSKISKNLKMLSIPYFGYESISKFYETILGSFLKIIIINVADMVYRTISSPKIIFTKLSSLSYSLFLKMHARVHMPVLAFFITK
jgi:hypothetical protein